MQSSGRESSVAQMSTSAYGCISPFHISELFLPLRHFWTMNIHWFGRDYLPHGLVSWRPMCSGPTAVVRLPTVDRMPLPCFIYLPQERNITSEPRHLSINGFEHILLKSISTAIISLNRYHCIGYLSFRSTTRRPEKSPRTAQTFQQRLALKPLKQVSSFSRTD